MKITKSRETLEKEFNIYYDNGKFYQSKPRAGIIELKPFINMKTHKYGKTVCYELIQMYNYKTHKPTLMSYHSFLYAWFKGEVPAGYDVDHIDGNTLNNDIDNLQLLTRKENLAKRKIKGPNQHKNTYTINSYNDNGLFDIPDEDELF